MAGLFETIQNTIAGALDKQYPGRPVLFEDVPQLKHMDSSARPTNWDADYFFVEIIPTSGTTFSSELDKMSMLIHITGHLQSESYREYRQQLEEIDPLFRPVFRFGNRAITVNSYNGEITEGLLHYEFILAFTHKARDTSTPDAPLAQDLAVSFKKEKKE